jgi:hypothetical protein
VIEQKNERIKKNTSKKTATTLPSSTCEELFKLAPFHTPKVLTTGLNGGYRTAALFYRNLNGGLWTNTWYFLAHWRTISQSSGD